MSDLPAAKQLVSDRDLLLNYFYTINNLLYLRKDNMFVMYKMEGDTIEIHHVYSDDGLDPLIELTEELVQNSGAKRVEGYIDNDYVHFSRSEHMLKKFGMEKFKVHGDFSYYERWL